MSWMKPLLNLSLRLFEKPHLARANPEKLRSSFEKKAKFWFRAPRDTSQKPFSFTSQVKGLWVTAQHEAEPAVILYFHGGGYVFGSSKTHSSMLARLAQLAGVDAALPDYRLAPEHRFPAAFDDCLAAYSALLDHGVPANRIIIGGDSAGGGLALAVLAEILVQGLPKPAGVFAFSPLTDMTYSSGSIAKNASKDVVLVSERAPETASMYLGDIERKTPQASPLFAQFTGACPVYLCVGDTEILLDDTTRMVSHLQSQEVAVTHHIAQNLPHVWPMFYNMLPEAEATLSEVADWITQTLFAASES